MPRIFTFGIPNYFNFTFRPGPAAVELSDRTVAVELDPNTNADAGATDEVKVISPSSRDDTGSIAVLPCGSLSKLPLEVRTMIYRKVLRFEKPIRHAHNFLDPHPPFMLAESSHIEEINAAILRTCRTIYQEAIHILYGTNRFYFRKSKDIEKFAFRGLSNISFGIYCSQHPYIAENITYGRLTMIRFLHLRIGRKSTGDDRKEIWSSWSNFFYPSEKSSEEQGQLVGFPALERLVLDFTDLDLDDRDTSRVRVTPFLKKLRPTGGLKHLTLIGVMHEQNLRDFKHGFVRHGGTFREAPVSVTRVSTVTVTHDDVPEVSMYVRAIVEKDMASRAILQSNENAR